MSFDLSDYVDVAERIAKFYAQYPDGRIAASPPRVESIDGKSFIAVTASVYRSETDPQPCIGSAWEPFPGKTPYTRESEAMNAETSAVGRALALAGIEVRRSISSRDEVQARQESAASKPPRRPRQDAPQAPTSPARPTDSARPSAVVTDKQHRMMMALLAGAGLKEHDEYVAYISDVIGRRTESSKDITPAEASRVIDALKGGA